MSEWPGGISGGDYDKRDVPIPEPKIEPDGTYRCSVCNKVSQQDKTTTTTT